VLTLAAGCGLASLHDTAAVSALPVNAGGILGDLVGDTMDHTFGFIGATVLLLALFLSSTGCASASWPCAMPGRPARRRKPARPASKPR